MTVALLPHCIALRRSETHASKCMSATRTHTPGTSLRDVESDTTILTASEHSEKVGRTETKAAICSVASYTSSTCSRMVQFRDQGYSILMRRATYSIDIIIRMYNEVPWNSEVMILAQHGNVERMQNLFHSGFASPFDRCGGKSLLHVSNGSMLQHFLHVLTVTRLPSLDIKRTYIGSSCKWVHRSKLDLVMTDCKLISQRTYMVRVSYI